MKRLFAALATVADGAFVINEAQRIIFWNKAATEILGHTADDIAGKPCYELLAGCDDRQQSICRENCRAAKAIFNGGMMTNFDVHVHTKAGGTSWINMSTFSYPTRVNGSDRVLVHLFRDINSRKREERFVHEVLEAAAHLQQTIQTQRTTLNSAPAKRSLAILTNREREVLALLAQGAKTDAIAESLCISSTTVRTHVRNILQKLRVNSRLEAVVYAVQLGLAEQR